jgi:hypothetical protein
VKRPSDSASTSQRATIETKSNHRNQKDKPSEDHQNALLEGFQSARETKTSNIRKGLLSEGTRGGTEPIKSKKKESNVNEGRKALVTPFSRLVKKPSSRASKGSS